MYKERIKCETIKSQTPGVKFNYCSKNTKQNILKHSAYKLNSRTLSTAIRWVWFRPGKTSTKHGGRLFSQNKCRHNSTSVFNSSDLVLVKYYDYKG